MFVINCENVKPPNSRCCSDTSVMCPKCAAQALTHNVVTDEGDGMAMLDYQPPIDVAPAQSSLVNNQAESDAALDAFRIKQMFGI